MPISSSACGAPLDLTLGASRAGVVLDCGLVLAAVAALAMADPPALVYLIGGLIGGALIWPRRRGGLNLRLHADGTGQIQLADGASQAFNWQGAVAGRWVRLSVRREGRWLVRKYWLTPYTTEGGQLRQLRRWALDMREDDGAD